MPVHEYCPGGRNGRVLRASVSPLAHRVLCVFGGPSSPALKLYEFFSRSFLCREVSFLHNSSQGQALESMQAGGRPRG